jgi:hypothetical protein
MMQAGTHTMNPMNSIKSASVDAKKIAATSAKMSRKRAEYSKVVEQ